MAMYKSSEAPRAKGIVVDTRMFFMNGRIYIGEYPTENGIQCDFPSYIDITEKVAEAISPYLVVWLLENGYINNDK